MHFISNNKFLKALFQHFFFFLKKQVFVQKSVLPNSHMSFIQFLEPNLLIRRIEKNGLKYWIAATTVFPLLVFFFVYFFCFFVVLCFFTLCSFLFCMFSKGYVPFIFFFFEWQEAFFILLVLKDQIIFYIKTLSVMT